MDEFTEGVERVTAGLEKRQRIMHADEKQRVAYHESGHALVAASLPNTDPVHKVSIIPRGLAALGYMMQRPEGDRYLLTQSELESRIQVALAGTLGEEMIFGDVSTGAQNDLERATEIARSMVMDYGMSRLGRVSYRESRRSVFLATQQNDLAGDRSHSEQTAREIDEEIKHILEEAQVKVRHILQTRRPALGGAGQAADRHGDDRQRRIEADPRREFAHAEDRARHRPTRPSPALCPRRPWRRTRRKGRGEL